MASVDSVVLEGWSTFFGEIACFLRDCERNEDTTDQRKLEYICERLENCIAHIMHGLMKKCLTVMMGFVS